MHNQHTDLSQTLADQHRTQLQDQATHRRPLPPPVRAAAAAAAGRRSAGGSCSTAGPRGPANQPALSSPIDRPEAPMSKSRLTQAVVPALLAAANLASMTAVAVARPATSPPASRTHGGRPPKARSEKPGTGARPRPTSPPSPATGSSRPPRARSGSPGILGRASRCARTSRPTSPAASSRPWPSWPPPWRWPAGLPRGEQAGDLGPS